jgi:hypothetical protein
MVYLLVFHAYIYWGFQFLMGSLRDVFISRSTLKGKNAPSNKLEIVYHFFICYYYLVQRPTNAQLIYILLHYYIRGISVY